MKTTIIALPLLFFACSAFAAEEKKEEPRPFGPQITCKQFLDDKSAAIDGDTKSQNIYSFNLGFIVGSVAAKSGINPATTDDMVLIEGVAEETCKKTPDATIKIVGETMGDVFLSAKTPKQEEKLECAPKTGLWTLPEQDIRLPCAKAADKDACKKLELEAKEKLECIRPPLETLMSCSMNAALKKKSNSYIALLECSKEALGM